MSGFSAGRRRRGFTLVELLVVMAIMALLAGLALPAYRSAIATAQSTQCASNLRNIGVAVTQATSDNNNQYPAIVQDDDGNSGVAAAYLQATPPITNPPDLYDALSPYGVTQAGLKCPSDNGQTGYTYPYTVNGVQYTSSYEWDPVYDDELTTSTTVYIGPAAIAIPAGRLRLCMDFNANHHGHMNVLYGDGHVRKR
jgi:prepilin-type N-terminal cleavage/methylation domain-containing protein/prepilin-type processing-associated H-X9-DG protein